MKKRVLFGLVINALLFSCQTVSHKQTHDRNYMNGWKEGQYVTYLMTYKNGDWESYKIALLTQDKKGIWPVVLRVRSLQHDFYMLFHAKGMPDKKSAEISPVLKLIYYKNISGKKLTKEKILSYYVFMLNLVKMRIDYYENQEQYNSKYKTVTKDFGCAIEKARQIVDEWPEFEYIRYYYQNNEIPILGFAEVKCSDERFNFKMLSYGRNTLDEYAGFDDPTFINFYYFKTMPFDSFELSYPADWFLDKKSFKKTVEKRNKESYVAFLGGNNHAGFLHILEYTTASAGIKSEISTIEKEFLDKSRKIGFTLLKKKVINTQNILYIFNFDKYQQSGFQVAGLRVAPDNRSLVIITVFSNFSDNNVLKYKMNEYRKQALAIIDSFRFTLRKKIIIDKK